MPPISVEELLHLTEAEAEAIEVSEIPYYCDHQARDFVDPQAKIAIEKKKKPKAHTQDCQGGDPGVKFVLDFNTACALPERVHWVNVDIFLGIPEEQKTRSLSGTKVSADGYQYHVSFTMDANNGPRDNPERHNELDLAEPYTILVPFVDVNWFKKKHYDKDIKYRLEFKYNEIDEVRHYEEGVIKASETHSGPFAFKTDRNTLPSQMPWIQKIGDMHFDEVIYTQEGVWWKMHYVGNEPRPTYLVGEYGANANFCPRVTAYGNSVLHKFESCFLPYPRLKNRPQELRHKCSLFVGNGHERRIFHHPVDYVCHQGEWEIIGTAITEELMAEQDHTRSVSPDPSAGAPPVANPTASEPTQSGFFGIFKILFEQIKSIFS